MNIINIKINTKIHSISIVFIWYKNIYLDDIEYKYRNDNK